MIVYISLRPNSHARCVAGPWVELTTHGLVELHSSHLSYGTYTIYEFEGNRLWIHFENDQIICLFFHNVVCGNLPTTCRCAWNVLCK